MASDKLKVSSNLLRNKKNLAGLKTRLNFMASDKLKVSANLLRNKKWRVID